MGRKRKRRALKPFCYYCDRLFEDEATLTQHQKARHFKCPFCSKRLPAALSLLTHVQGVHKETLEAVPNANPGRESMAINIYGMSGVPEDAIREQYRAQFGEEPTEEQPQPPPLIVPSLPNINIPTSNAVAEETNLVYKDQSESMVRSQHNRLVIIIVHC